MHPADAQSGENCLLLERQTAGRASLESMCRECAQIMHGKKAESSATRKVFVCVFSPTADPRSPSDGQYRRPVGPHRINKIPGTKPDDWSICLPCRSRVLALKSERSGIASFHIETIICSQSRHKLAEFLSCPTEFILNFGSLVLFQVCLFADWSPVLRRVAVRITDTAQV